MTIVTTIHYYMPLSKKFDKEIQCRNCLIDNRNMNAIVLNILVFLG